MFSPVSIPCPAFHLFFQRVDSLAVLASPPGAHDAAKRRRKTALAPGLPAARGKYSVSMELPPVAGATPLAPPADIETINLRWLLRLRWVAIAGQVVLILAVEATMRLALPLVPIFALIGLEAASNVACARWARARTHVPPRALTGLIVADTAALTALLYLTGGAVNPFTFLYLVHVTLAAVVLRSRASWLVLAVALGAYGMLFLVPGNPPEDGHAGHQPDHLRLHLVGMWVAFAVAAGFIVYFVQQITSALARRDAELAEARTRTARNERFASLAALAAGAAHELATPLSTIAVVAKELDRQLARDGADAVTLGDVRLIRQQVDRCRDILTRMAADGGETPAPVTLDRLVAEAIDGLPPASRCEVSLPPETARATISVPVHAVAQALRAVLQNAVQASPPSSPVRLTVARRGAEWQFVVRDDGPGMEPAVLRHAGEPFFTTKPPGHGMGLGLYLARTTISQVGGRLDITSAAEAGTTVIMVLPATAAAKADCGDVAIVQGAGA